MYRFAWFLNAALVSTTVALVQPIAAAKSASEVKAIARSVTVEIKLKQNGSVGSGVIINRQGDLYTLATNRHVVCGNERCSELPSTEIYNLGLADGQQYRVKISSIKLLGSDLDLAIIQFRSNRNYAVAKVAPSDSLKFDDEVYTAGFPFEQNGFTFDSGEAIAVVNKRLTGDGGGYTIIYNASTLPGMSGGGVFDSSGQLVAIHGYGDRFKENTEINNESRIDHKIGYNRGIPVLWLEQNLAKVGISLETGRNRSGRRVARPQTLTNADEHLIAGFNKFVEPGDNVVAGKKQAIQKISAAIQLNPKYRYAYFLRAVAHEQIEKYQESLADYNQAILLNIGSPQVYYNLANLKAERLNDFQGALADYNQAILLNPKDSDAYNNRAALKTDRLNDIQGGLADYNQAIIFNSKNSLAYYNRANLEVDKLNNIQSALADYNQAIFINPKYLGAYLNRANLKKDKLNDIQGALADYNQIILLNPKYSLAYNNRALLKYEKLNDIQGSLADYNQAILLNHQKPITYYNRALLKYQKLNDRAGAIQDFRQAAQLFRAEGNTQYLQQVIRFIERLGAKE
jgi:tetratricopeptide (TPR) repeat protein